MYILMHYNVDKEKFREINFLQSKFRSESISRLFFLCVGLKLYNFFIVFSFHTYVRLIRTYIRRICTKPRSS